MTNNQTKVEEIKEEETSKDEYNGERKVRSKTSMYNI